MQTLTGRANISVAGSVISRLIFAEQTRLDRGTALWARHIGLDPGFLAMQVTACTRAGEPRRAGRRESAFVRRTGLIRQPCIQVSRLSTASRDIMARAAAVTAHLPSRRPLAREMCQRHPWKLKVPGVLVRIPTKPAPTKVSRRHAIPVAPPAAAVRGRVNFDRSTASQSSVADQTDSRPSYG